MKIAVLGSAGSSVGLAPFRNEAFALWAEGKSQQAAQAQAQIGGEWQIWGCSPGCWAVVPRATRWFEVHRWEPGQPWLSPEYTQFLRDFPGIVYTGGAIPEIKNHVVYPVDYIEEKFSSYFLTSSLSLMMALAIDTIEQIRATRTSTRNPPISRDLAAGFLPRGIPAEELDKPDTDDVIGLWGVDMAAGDEYQFQRPGCQFFILEAQRRGIGIYLPPESDLMRPMPVYGISEWDHSYIKLTTKAREMSVILQQAQQKMKEAETQAIGIQAEMHALNYFVSTWTSPYGMLPGHVSWQAPGTGMGTGITSYDSRPISRMNLGESAEKAEVMKAMAEPPPVPPKPKRRR